jgi:AGZA family xanthine/uracil permease-like MFS transporter
MGAMKSFLREKLISYFQLTEHGTTIGTEILAGVTTFLTMGYVIFANPVILSVTGMDFGATFFATCVAAAIGTAVMGLYANYPVALAPGMGLNAFFAYTVVQGMGYSWQVALGVVFLSGVLFVILSVLPVREWIINSIPITLKLAISAGIGLFIAMIGLRNAEIVVADPATFVTLGNLLSPAPLLALGGFALIVALDHRRVPGAIIIGILASTLIGLPLGLSEWKGIVSLPPDPMPTLLQLDLSGALQMSLIAVIFTFLFIDLFDTAGTLVGVAHRGGLLDSRGRLPRLRRALLADSTASVAGAVLGTSTTTSYVESVAGIKVGGRTGLTAVTVALLFLLCLFLSPLAQTVAAYAAAPALLFIGCLMARGLAEIDWEDATEYAPAVVTVLAMPLTFSITDGIGLGLIVYAAAKILSRGPRACPPAILAIAILFLLKFALL